MLLLVDVQRSYRARFLTRVCGVCDPQCALEYIFCFSFVWGVGGAIESTCWDRFDEMTRNLFSGRVNFPQMPGTVFDFYVDPLKVMLLLLPPGPVQSPSVKRLLTSRRRLRLGASHTGKTTSRNSSTMQQNHTTRSSCQRSYVPHNPHGSFSVCTSPSLQLCRLPRGLLALWVSCTCCPPHQTLELFPASAGHCQVQLHAAAFASCETRCSSDGNQRRRQDLRHAASAVSHDVRRDYPLHPQLQRTDDEQGHPGGLSGWDLVRRQEVRVILLSSTKRRSFSLRASSRRSGRTGMEPPMARGSCFS